ncbi:flagellar protein FlgN [Desulfovibrio psychrotolerans]|uniref:Flagellar protein FlgN n=1 Tax=Desulfovibrio psychrotolerans TaxID=415242 RepID=A0A7J0BX90_9BACT|nr:flagellar protein FlgN [Desulfovibrio psychrotolerans]GFM37795.1 flagellar protein FlgN [Desulfovibrio psychrotolerans]
MFSYANGNLVRQYKGLQVLDLLIREEFAQLRDNKPQEVTATEFAIHELMRQIAVERLELRKELGGKRLRELTPTLPEEEQVVLEQLLDDIDLLEQECARQASMNARLALALHDQNQHLLEFLHDQVAPKAQNTYGKMGRFTQSRPQASLIQGRL